MERIGKMMAKVGAFKEALQIACEIPDVLARSHVLQAVIAGLIKTGKTTEALEILQALMSTEDFAWILKGLANVLVTTGMVEEFLELAREVKDEADQCELLCELARELARAGMAEKARALFAQAREVATRLDTWKKEALLNIAKAMAEAGMTEDAKKTFRGVETLVPLREFLLHGHTETMVKEFTKTLANLGEWDEAIRIAVEVGTDLSHSLYPTARGLAQAHAFAPAIFVAECIPDPDLRLWALLAIAEELTKVGEKQRAQELSFKALTIALENEDQLVATWEVATAILARAGFLEELINFYGSAGR